MSLRGEAEAIQQRSIVALWGIATLISFTRDDNNAKLVKVLNGIQEYSGGAKLFHLQGVEVCVINQNGCTRLLNFYLSLYCCIAIYLYNLPHDAMAVSRQTELRYTGLILIPSDQQRAGDCNCENFTFIVSPHAAPDGSRCFPATIVDPKQLDEDRGGVGYWTCECGRQFEVFVPLNSDME